MVLQAALGYDFVEGCVEGALCGIKYLIEAGRAYLSSEKPDVAGGPKMHGKVNL